MPVSAFQSDLVVRDDDIDGALAFPANSATFAALDGAKEVVDAPGVEVEVDVSWAALALPFYLPFHFFFPDCVSALAVMLAAAYVLQSFCQWPS